MTSTESRNSEPAALRLKKREERRLRAGHLWVYSNEVDTRATPLNQLSPGQLVQIESYNGKVLATGYANPHSLICARVVSRNPERQLDAALLQARLEEALALRARLYPAPHYRLVFGESDGLPGLVVDRYGDYLSVQITTAGMELRKAMILEALDVLLKPRGIMLRNDTPVREMEGLERYTEVIGEIPEQIEVQEQDARFRASLSAGQKTGFFFDQADNRSRMLRYVQGRRVLDLFSYIGAWGIRAALGGASGVLCVDASDEAMQQAKANAELNGVTDRVETRTGDVFDILKNLREVGERFDVVIADPPAFVKRKKDLEAGTEAYRRLNQQAAQLLAADGILISASCSFHMDALAFQRAVGSGVHKTGRRLQILERGGQAADHPIHPAMPETEYLKALYCRVLSH